MSKIRGLGIKIYEKSVFLLVHYRDNILHFREVLITDRKTFDLNGKLLKILTIKRIVLVFYSTYIHLE